MHSEPTGGGALLSRGSLAKTVEEGNNVVGITSAGVVKKVVVSLGNAKLTIGKATEVPLIVMAQDAAGNTIIGPYDSEVTLLIFRRSRE